MPASDNDHAAEDDALQAHMYATGAAIHVLVRLLEQGGALRPGRYPSALRGYMSELTGEAPALAMLLLDQLAATLEQPPAGNRPS